METIKIYPTQDLSKEIILFHLGVNFSDLVNENDLLNVIIDGKIYKLYCKKNKKNLQIPSYIKYNNLWYSFNGVEPNVFLDIENDAKLEFYTEFCTNPILYKRKKILTDNYE